MARPSLLAWANQGFSAEVCPYQRGLQQNFGEQIYLFLFVVDHCRSLTLLAWLADDSSHVGRRLLDRCSI